MIDNTKWNTYEFAREVVDGEFRSKIRSSSKSQGAISNQLDFVEPLDIRDFQASVTPVVFQNNEGVNVAGSLQGFFFNDGTAGGGPDNYLGEVGAGIFIGGNEATPEAYWSVWRFPDVTNQNPKILAIGTFKTPITLGETYDLFLGWNEKARKFTFKIRNEAVEHYRPVGTIYPSNRPWKTLRTWIWNLTHGQEATIDFRFDGVKVNYDPKLGKTK